MTILDIETQICNRLYKLKAYIKHYTGTWGAEQEDMYGDALLRLCEANRTGKIKEDLFSVAFMYRCAKFAVCEYHRKKNAEIRTHNDEYDYHFNILVESPEKQYENIIKIDAFIENLETLENIHKRVLLLLLFQGMNHNEIAEILDIPRATVSCYILRMRKQFGDIDLNKTRIRENIQMER